MIVVEGQIRHQVDPPAWNIWMFGNGGDFDVRANFADNLPASILSTNATVRIIGVPNNGEVAVEGLEIMGSSSAQPNATNAQERTRSISMPASNQRLPVPRFCSAFPIGICPLAITVDTACQPAPEQKLNGFRKSGLDQDACSPGSRTMNRAPPRGE